MRPSVLSQRTWNEDACQRCVGVFISLAHILAGGYCRAASAFLPDQVKGIAESLSPAEIAKAL